MDRPGWLAERRAAVAAVYDTEASTYDATPYPATSHAAFVDRLLATCPPDGIVLDAPCGTGRWFGQVRQEGRRVVGIDQSSGMLERARRTGLAERLEHVGLQEMAFDGEFDAAMTIDAMENVPPEDWPVVLDHLQRAVRPGGYLYLTVEEVPESDLDTAETLARERGLPAVRGEVIEGDVAGYHFYPGRDLTLRWFADAGLSVVDEEYDQEDGWGYRHWLVRTAPSR